MPAITYSWQTIASAFILTNDPINNAADEEDPAIAVLTTGSYVALWTGIVGGNVNISRDVLSPAGVITAPQTVANSTIGGAIVSSAAGLTNGNFVMAYDDASTSANDGNIRFRLFDSNGTPLGPDARVFDTTLQEYQNDVAALPNGAFVIASDITYTNADVDIWVQRFNANGTKNGSVIVVDNSGTLDTFRPSIAGLTSGGFVVSWSQVNTPDPNGTNPISAWFQLYDQFGAPVGGHKAIDTGGTQNINIDSVALRDGGFAFVYEDNGAGTGSKEISLRIYNADGSPRTGVLTVNDQFGGDQTLPTITQLSNDFLLIGYTDGTNMRYRAFDPFTGNPIFQSTRTGAFVIEGEIAALSSGLVAAVQSSTFADVGGGSSIRTQVNELTRTTTGDSTSESLVGDSLRDTMSGNGGNDSLNGAGGNDTLFGGTGTDTLIGGDGNDVLVGNGGGADTFVQSHDSFDGGFGDDTIYAMAGDSIAGGSGRDVLQVVNDYSLSLDLAAVSIEYVLSGFGNDIYSASSTAEAIEVYGGGGNDQITGGSGDDRLWGGVGDDILVGNDGNDVLVGDVGADSLSGGSGNDRLYVDSSDTSVSGGAGFDAIYITGGAGLSINLASAQVEWAADFVGGNDTIDGSGMSSNLEIYAGGGTDTVLGGSGNDLLWAGAGNDILVGNDGNDTLVGETAGDRLTGGAGTDTLYGNSGNGADGAMDIFVFGDGWGTDFVFDFEHNVDKIDMTAVSGLNDFSQLTLTNTPAGHCYVSFSGNLIAVANHTTANLTASDFLL